MDPAAKAILEGSKVPGYHKVYAIASSGKRINVCAQQCRSLNLAWALQQAWAAANGEKSSRPRVWILGAGAGGITCAAALALVDAEVAVFDKFPEPMHLQLGCHHRFLHPRVVEWPAQHSTMAGANLPILDWVVGTAHEVRKRIVDQYEEIMGHKKLNPRLIVVNDFNVAPDGYVTFVEPEPSERTNLKIQPDFVILALGFGIEKTTNSLPRQSYWRLDSLDQTPLDTNDRPRRVLICGAGDGGAIDFLRVALRGFDHGPFLDFACELLDKARADVVAIERDAERMRSALLAATPRTAASRFVVEDAVSRYLQRRYEELQIDAPDAFEELHKFLKAQQRPDTEVDWNGFGAERFGMLFNTQPLHRILAWQVLRLSPKFRYRQEKLYRVRVLDQETTSGPRYEAELAVLTAASDGMKESEPLARKYHQVIVRHGTEPALASAFPGIALALENRRTRADALDDERREEWTLAEEVRKFWWDRAASLTSRQGQPPARKMCARVVEKVADEVHKETKLACLKIRLHFDADPLLLERVRWVDYFLYTRHDKGEPLRRRATHSVAVRTQEPFALSIFTWDDYEIEAKLSDGSQVPRVSLCSLLKESQQLAGGLDAVTSLQKAKELLEAEEKAGDDALLGKLRGSAHRLRTVGATKTAGWKV